MAPLPSICSQPLVAKLRLKNDKVLFHRGPGTGPICFLSLCLACHSPRASLPSGPEQNGAPIPKGQPSPGSQQAPSFARWRQSCFKGQLWPSPYRALTGLAVQSCGFKVQLCHLQQCVRERRLTPLNPIIFNHGTRLIIPMADKMVPERL